jgi:hypothetical protein
VGRLRLGNVNEPKRRVDPGRLGDLDRPHSGDPSQQAQCVVAICGGPIIGAPEITVRASSRVPRDARDWV